MVFRNLFIALAILLNSTFAYTLSSQEFIDVLEEKGQLGVFDHAMKKHFEDTCSSINISSAQDLDIQNMCHVVAGTDLCKQLPEEDRLNCNDYDNDLSFDPIDFFAGCVEGLFDAAVDLIKFVWSIIKWSFNTVTHPVESYTQANEYIDSMKLYLVNEYDKELEKASFPFKQAKAIKAVSGKIISRIYNALEEVFYSSYKQVGCMNFQARSKAMCKFAGEFLVPPGAVAFKLFTKGAKGVKIAKKLDVDAKKSVDVDVDLGPKIDKPGHNATSSTRNADPMNTGDPDVDKFRKAFMDNNLEGDNQFVSFVDENNERVVGRILAKNEHGVVIENLKGVQSVLNDKRSLSSIKHSELSKKYFDASNKPPYLILTGDKAKDDFRRAYNSRKYNTDQTFVSYEINGVRKPARIINTDGRSLVVENIDGTRFEIPESLISTVRQSSTTKTHFNNVAKMNSISLTGNAGTDRFRKAFNQRNISGDDKYISYAVKGGNVRLAVKVDRFDRDSVQVEDYNGNRYTLTREELKTARYSDTSSNSFKEQALKEGHIVRETLPTKVLQADANNKVNQFRTNFNNGKFVGDDVYVSIPYGPERYVAKVEGVTHNAISVTVVDDFGIKRTVKLQDEDLLAVRNSSAAKEAFVKDGRYMSTPSEVNIQGQIIGRYEQFGYAVDINPSSPGLRKWVGEAQRTIEHKTGIKPGVNQNLTVNQKIEIYKVWLNDIVKKVESRERGSSYGDNRSLLGKRNGGRVDLGQAIEEGKAVCLELSMFASTVLKQYGIDSKVGIGKTNVRVSEKGKHGYHAWLQVIDKNGNPLEILDSNNSRSVHPNSSHYSDRLNGVEVEREIGLIQ